MSAKALAKPSTEYSWGFFFFFSCSVFLSSSFFSYAFRFQFQLVITGPQELLNVTLVHTQTNAPCHLNHSLANFCNSLILCKPFEVREELLECLLPEAIYTHPGDITPSPGLVMWSWTL